MVSTLYQLLEEVIPTKHRTVKKALPVIVREPLNGPWTGNNNLGFTTDFAPDSNNRQVILKLPEWGHPTVWTADLYIDFDDPMPASGGGPTPLYDFEVIAEVTVGAGGTAHNFDMDWKRGSSFSMAFNALTIHARYVFQNIPDIGLIVPPNLRLGVIVSRGNRQKDWNATRTLPVNHLPALVTANPLYWVNVPKLTRKVKLYPNNMNLVGIGIHPLYSANTLITLQSSNFTLTTVTGDVLLTLGSELVLPNSATILKVEGPYITDNNVLAIFDLGG